MQPSNLLFILSDQHNRDVMGAYGHSLVRTPHLDALAARGTRFTAAYTPCPICVPARAALATGRYVHQIRYWDNAFPYDGAVPSWGHRLRTGGFRVDSIGKLHFRSVQDDNGFSTEVEPLHVVDGEGDLLGSIREDAPARNKRVGVLRAGPGDSTYLQYDARNADNACLWLDEHAQDEKPWALFLSFVCPHPPYVAPQELYDLYPLADVPLPAQWHADDWPDHPVVDEFRRFFNYSVPFQEEEVRNMVAAYLGVCTYLDAQIGRVLGHMEDLGLGEHTRVIYSSDHGESMGARGLFGKFTMYEESAAVPLLLAGPGVPVGKVVNTPVSLLDCFPTILDAVGAEPEAADEEMPGRSLWEIAAAPDEARTVLSEYHALGTRSGVFMLRDKRHKFIYNVGQPSQLFDLEADPDEEDDLAGRPEYETLAMTFEGRLRAICDPEAVDIQAKLDQAALIEAHGGDQAVRARGAFDNSPVPGEAPSFRLHD